MLRYYVYFYFCGAAITAYVGFLELRFEQARYGDYPGDGVEEEGEEELGGSSEEGGRRFKRQADDPRTLIRKMKEKFAELRRHYKSVKLQRLRERGLTDMFPKVNDAQTVLEKPNATLKRRKRQTQEQTKEQTKEQAEEQTKERTKERTRELRNQETQSDMETEKKRQRIARRAKRIRTTTEAEMHAEENEHDVYISDPNAFFEQDSNDVQPGLANQLFVVHWMRTLGYFILTQLLIFCGLFCGCFIWGYYKYEVWKMKEHYYYKKMVAFLAKFQKKPELGRTGANKQFNADTERMEKKLAKAKARREKLQNKKLAAKQVKLAMHQMAKEKVKEMQEERMQGGQPPV